MPTGQNWINFIYVNLGFLAQVLVMYYFTALIEIKKNWPEYRCNPLYLPLSDNMTEDFTYCVQNTQINLMGYIMQPFTYLINSLTSMGGNFSDNLNGIRGMISSIRTFIRNIVEDIFAVFLNLVIEFQVIMIGIKDMMVVDPYPGAGARAIAAVAEGCGYYADNSYLTGLSKFLGVELGGLGEREHYDCAVIHFDWRSDRSCDVAEWCRRADMLLIFVPDKCKGNFPKPLGRVRVVSRHHEKVIGWFYHYVGI